MGSAAGLSRFDDFSSIQIFERIYSQDSSIYAAIPSMHAAYPMILVYFGWKNKIKLLTLFFVNQAVGIWFSAVYTMHHYIIDPLAGMSCAIIGIILFDCLMRNEEIRTWEKNYLIKFLKKLCKIDVKIRPSISK